MSSTGYLDTAIKEVENFIKQLHDSDIRISEQAQTIRMSIQKKSSFWSSNEREDRGCLADLLGHAIAKYQTFKEVSSIQINAAYELLDYIERARTFGVIVPQKLTSELEKTQQENAWLKEENDKLRKENLRLNQLNEGLHQVMNSLGFPRVQDDESGESEP